MLGNKYVAGVVGILLILVILYNAQFFISKNRTSSPAEKVQQAKRSGSFRQADKIRPAPAMQHSGSEDAGSWKRDPFSLQARTDSRAAEMADKIKLMGILKREGRSHALINGKVYGVDDRIGTAVIKEIHQHSIVVLTEGKKREIVFDDYKVIKEKKK